MGSKTIGHFGGHMRITVCILASVLAASASVQRTVHETNGPDCSGGWPTNMSFSWLKNAGLLTNAEVDFSKTKTSRLASQRVGHDLYHQVYLVQFIKRSGESVEAIAVHDASMEECSMAGVEVFVVSKHLNPGGKN